MTDLIVVKQRAYAQIEERYSCAHEDRELRARTIADGRQTFVTQCIRCGQTSNPIARRKAVELARGRAIPFYDINLEESWRGRKSEEYQKIFQELAPSLADEYECYLRSNVWHEKRKAVLGRATYQCELCEKASATEVHHLTYVRLGKELLTDLLAVCETCHQLIHAPNAV